MPQVYDPDLKVSDLIDPVKKDWDTNKLKSLLDPHKIPFVRSLHISRNSIIDGNLLGSLPAKKRIQEKCSAPMDTTKLASRECSAWLIANQEEDPRETVSIFLPGNHLETPTFTCRVDGSWKHDDATSKVGWILHLQDGSIDLRSLQGGHKEISPLHTELKSLTWALKILSRHLLYCNHFVTDSQ
ncbi:hypothetical protein YC2023_108870 [Brassica napus]